MSLTIELKVSAELTAFNLERWAEVLADPELARLPHRIETDRHGHILMSPPTAPSHGVKQAKIATLFGLLLPGRKMRDDFGPVTLVFGNGAMFVDAYRPKPLPVKPLQHEPYQTNGEAIAKACHVMDKCQTMYIVDENNDVIWNSVKLREECAKRRTKVKKG